MSDESVDSLCRMATDAALTEDLALSLLDRRDLPGEAIEALARNLTVMKSRKVLRAVVAHPRTPRHVSLPRARHLYTFELMELTLSPVVPADVKLAGEETILSRLGTISSGERLTLAKRASKRLAAALLLDPDARVMESALLNPRMTEASIVRALQSAKATPAFVQAIGGHPQWSLRREIQIALLRNPRTPSDHARRCILALPSPVLQELREYLPPEVAVAVTMELRKRSTAENQR